MQELWLAVLQQAEDDEKKKDTGYFSIDNEDFITVCDLAGVCPYARIEKAYRARKGI